MIVYMGIVLLSAVHVYCPKGTETALAQNKATLLESDVYELLSMTR